MTVSYVEPLPEINGEEKIQEQNNSELIKETVSVVRVTSVLHEELENEIKSLNTEAALIFTSCYFTTTLFTLATKLPGCEIFSDEGKHASMIRGIRNSGAPKHIFKHKDSEHLDMLLCKVGMSVPKLVSWIRWRLFTQRLAPSTPLRSCMTSVTWPTSTGPLPSWTRRTPWASMARRRRAGESIQDKIDIISGSPAYCNIGSEAEMRHVILDVDRRGLQLWSRSFKAN